MRIGLDARTICAPKTGDRTYALGLIHGLAALDCAHDFVVYVDQPPPARLPTGPRWSVRVVRALHPRLWTPLALPQAARRDGVDLLHVQYIAPTCRRPRVVTTIHDVTYRLFPQWFHLKDRFLLDRGVRSSLRTVACVLTGSECTRRDLERVYGLPGARICVTPYAAPPGFRAPEAGEVARVLAAHGLLPPYALFVGALQPRKNLPRLIRAFLAAKRSAGLPHRLVLAGKTGWKSGAVFATLREEGAAGDVKLLGYVPDEDLSGLFGGAEALLFPTLYEGFGLPVLEAFACGTPVITSNLSALPEVAGEAAVLVDPRDEAQMAEAVARVLTDAPLRRRLARAGLQRAEAFDWTRTAALTVACYEAAVAG